MKFKTFRHLPEDKQNAVIKASLNEFNRGGYKNASTNKIVKSVGISKGSIFQYFGSKDGLYYYLLKMAADHLIRDMEDGLRDLPDDLMARMKKVLEIILNLYVGHPDLIGMFLTLTEKEAYGIQEKLVLEYSGVIYRLMTKLFRGIRTDNLQFGLERSVDLFKWVLNGWMTELSQEENRGLSGDRIREKYGRKIDGLVELLKNGVYHREGGRAA